MGAHSQPASPAATPALVDVDRRAPDFREHNIRDVSYGEDASQIRTGSGPQVMAALRNLGIGILKMTGHASIAAACRHHARDATWTLATLGLSPL